jgi:hypothetical protein
MHTGLTLHRSYTSILEEQPTVHLIPLPCSFRIANLVVFVVPGDEVLHDRSRLEEINLLSIRESVCKSWDASIGIDLKKPILLLRVLGYFDLLNFVGKTAAGQKRGR